VLEVGGVAALVDIALPTVQLDHPGGDPVQQVPVVADQDHRPGHLGQSLLQPGHGGQVQMVGRLVEHEQVEGLGQDPGQGHALGLPPRQGGHVGPCPVPHAEAFEGGGGLPALPHRLGHGARRELRILVQPADRAAPAPAHPPLLGTVHPGDDAEQGRLARTVDSNDADPVTVGHGEGQVGEERSVRPGGRDVVQIYEHSHGGAGYRALGSGLAGKPL
jgi:hypothetical protein